MAEWSCQKSALRAITSVALALLVGFYTELNESEWADVFGIILSLRSSGRHEVNRVRSHHTLPSNPAHISHRVKRETNTNTLLGSSSGFPRQLNLQ